MYKIEHERQQKSREHNRVQHAPFVGGLNRQHRSEAFKVGQSAFGHERRVGRALEVEGPLEDRFINKSTGETTEECSDEKIIVFIPTKLGVESTHRLEQPPRDHACRRQDERIFGNEVTQRRFRVFRLGRGNPWAHHFSRQINTIRIAVNIVGKHPRSFCECGFEDFDVCRHKVIILVKKTEMRGGRQLRPRVSSSRLSCVRLVNESNS